MRQNRLDGGEAILEAFRNLSIDYVICSPGSEWPPFWEAIARQKRDGLSGPRYMDIGHETLAVAMAHGYTNVTGRMQAVLLHAGAGLLQGAIAVSGARAMSTPMLVMSGESLSYGEAAFDPGSHWYRNLSVVGGPQRWLEPLVKWAHQAPVPETLYQTVIRAGELALRTPKGPTFVCASIEAMMHEWQRPAALRTVPPPPVTRPSDEAIDEIAALIVKAKCPVISTLTAGPNREAFDALVALADAAGIAVVEGQGGFFGNFPKSNELYLGSRIAPLLQEMDLVLLVDSWAPWYPPGNVPRQAQIVAISADPLRDTMAYQTLEASHYLEGSVAATLQLLTAAVQRIGIDPAQLAARKARWKAEHSAWRQKIDRAEDSASRGDVITVPLLMKTLRDMLPADAVYVDETIMHAAQIRDHVLWETPDTYFRTPSGLGQGLGYALGIKLAMPNRDVVMTIGDGTFLYNPVIPALTAARDHNLPLLILICNNRKYSIMEMLHDRFYPDSVAAEQKGYLGVHIPAAQYEEAADVVGGYGQLVEKPADLRPALEAALQCVRGGKPAILNLMIPEQVAGA